MMAFYDDFHPVFCIFLLYFNDFTIFAKYDNPLSYLFTIRWTMFFFTVPAAEYFPRKPGPDLPSPRASSSTSTFLWTFVRQKGIFFIFMPLLGLTFPCRKERAPVPPGTKGSFFCGSIPKGQDLYVVSRSTSLTGSTVRLGTTLPETESCIRFITISAISLIG